MIITFFSLFCLSTKDRIPNYSKIIQLSREQAPAFQYNPSDLYSSDIFDKKLIDTSIQDTVIQAETSKSYQYYTCSLTIRKAIFIDNNALAQNRFTHYGGAVFLSESLSTIYESTFISNKALVGGSIASIRSSILINSENPSNFSDNSAHNYGGAIYFQGYDYRSQNERNGEVSLFIFGSYFIHNQAGQLGGAISISLESDTYFENNVYKQNNAGAQGGAVDICNAKASFFNCFFLKNTAGIQLIPYSEENKLVNYQSNLRNGFIGHGCAGISFISSTQSHNLITQECCFASSEMYNGYDGKYHVDPSKVAGFDIMMQGNVKFNSYSTRFVNFNGNNWIHIGNPTDYTEQVYETLNGGVNECSGDDPIIRQINFNTVDKINNENSNITSEIPAPTLFTYFATPITRLPFQTTSSYIVHNPMNENLDVKAQTRSVAKTATPTAVNTPHITPHITVAATEKEAEPDQTPYRTPFATFSKVKEGETPAPTVNPMLVETISSTYSLTNTNYMSVSYKFVETSVGTTPTNILTKTMSNILTMNENSVTFAESETYAYSLTKFDEEMTTTLIFPVYASTSGETITQVEIHTYSQASTFSFVRGGFIPKIFSEWTKASTGYTVTNTVLMPDSSTQTFLTYIESETLTYKRDDFFAKLFDNVKTNPVFNWPILSPFNEFMNNIGNYIKSVSDNDFNEIAKKNPPKLTMVSTSIVTYTSTVIDRRSTVLTYTEVASGNFFVSLIERVERVREDGFSLVALSNIVNPITEVFSKLKPPVDLYKEVSTVSLTETVTITSGQSYFSGYMSYDTDTFILAYVPTETFCSSFVSGVYTYTASTTLSQTYSFVSQSEVIISYIPIQTEFETNTNTLIETNYKTKLFQPILELTQKESEYYTTTKTQETFSMTTTQINVENIPTYTTIYSEIFNRTYTFTKTNLLFGIETITFKETDYVYDVTEVNTSILSTSTNVNYITLITETDVETIVKSMTTVSTLFFNKKALEFKPPRISNLPSIQMPSFHNVLVTDVLTSSLTSTQTETIGPVLTSWYRTNPNTVTQIWTENDVYKSTFNNEGTYTYTKTKTVTQIVTKIEEETDLQTVIDTKINTATETLIETNIRTFNKNLFMSNSRKEVETYTVTYGNTQTYIPTTTVYSSTVAELYTLSQELKSTNTVIKVPTSTLNGLFLTKTDTYVVRETETLVDKYEKTALYFDTETSVVIYNLQDTETYYANKGMTNSYSYSIVKQPKPGPPPKSTVNSENTELMTFTRSETKTFDETLTDVVKYKSQSTNVNTYTVITTSSTIYTSTYTSVDDTFVYTYTKTDFYTETIVGPEGEYDSYTTEINRERTNTEFMTYVYTNVYDKTYSYSETNVKVTTTTGNDLTTTTIIYQPTQAKSGDVISSLTYTLSEVYTNFGDSVTYTLTETETITTAVIETDIFTTYATKKETSTNWITTITNERTYTKNRVLLEKRANKETTISYSSTSSSDDIYTVSAIETQTSVYKFTNVKTIQKFPTLLIPKTENYIHTVSYTNQSTFTKIPFEGETYTYTEVKTIVKQSVDFKRGIASLTFTETMVDWYKNTYTMSNYDTVTNITKGDKVITSISTEVETSPQSSTTVVNSTTKTYTSFTANTMTSKWTYLETDTSKWTFIKTTDVGLPELTYTKTKTNMLTYTQTKVTSGYTWWDVLSETSGDTIITSLEKIDTVGFSIIPLPPQTPKPTEIPRTPTAHPTPSKTPTMLPTPSVDPDKKYNTLQTLSETDTWRMYYVKTNSILMTNINGLVFTYTRELYTYSYSSTKTNTTITTYEEVTAEKATVMKSSTTIVSETATETESQTYIETNTSVEDNGTMTQSATYVFSNTRVIFFTYTMVDTETLILIEQNSGGSGPSISNGTQILLATIGIAMATAVGILGVYFYRKSKETSSFTDSYAELDDIEEIGKIPEILAEPVDENATITNNFSMSTNEEDDEFGEGFASDKGENDDIYTNGEI